MADIDLSSDHPLSVSVLKQINFSRLTLEEKVKIKDLGRPLPELSMSQESTGLAQKKYKRSFNTEQYEKTKWLCGCDTLNALFCFPCLLFNKGKGRSKFGNEGFTNLSNLSRSLEVHSNSSLHLQSVIDFDNLQLGKDIRTYMSAAYGATIQAHNEKVRVNLEVLHEIVDAVFLCGEEDLP